MAIPAIWKPVSIPVFTSAFHNPIGTMMKKYYPIPSTRVYPFFPDRSFCESGQDDAHCNGQVEDVQYVNWLDLLS